MNVFGSKIAALWFLIIADFLVLTQVTANDEYRKCYNTSVDMHCFAAQYDNTNNRWLNGSVQNARQRCKDRSSHLIIIKDEETNQRVKQFLDDSNTPIRNYYVWTDADRINDYNKTYRWQWLNSTLPNMSASDVQDTYDSTWYVASLAFRDTRFFLTAQEPHISNGYICEYTVAYCSSITSKNARQINSRCYVAMNESVNWFEARNRCLKGGGDLASFANVTSIDFTPWLGSDPDVRYWIGLRFARYIWKDSGEDVKFSKLVVNYDDWVSPCLIVCYNCNPTFSWLPKDCNSAENIYVVCQTVTSLISTTTTSTTITTTRTREITSSGLLTNYSNSSPNEPITPLGIGLGVGLGVPLVIATIISIILAVRRESSPTMPKQKPSDNGSQMDIIPEQPVEQVYEMPEDQYQHIILGSDDSTTTMYDELRVAPESNYEEVP